MSSTDCKWEISMMRFEEKGRSRYKVTRRYAELHVAETKVFDDKEEAQKQFEEWLG